MKLNRFSFVASILVLSSAVQAGDWPQWNGPTGKGIVTEDGLLKAIPTDGLKPKWRKPAAWGYSGPAVVDGRVFLTDYIIKSGDIANSPNNRDELKGTERVLCLDAASGKTLWKHEYERDYAVSYGGGPRVVPTVHEGRVYAVGAEGDLWCLDAKTGKVAWEHHYKKEYNADTPLWGHSAAPLIHNGSLICLVGGKGSLIVAFDLQTGKEQWKALSTEGKDGTGYCPPTIVKHAGVEQLLVWSPANLYSLNPDTREVFWKQPLKPGYGMSILPPLHHGKYLYAGGEGSQGLMLELAAGKPAAKTLWRGTPRTGVYFATSGGIFDDGYIYGSDTRLGAMVCVRATDGKRMWQTTRPTQGKEGGRPSNYASAFLMKLKDCYLIFCDSGDVITATMTPDGYKETGRFHAIEPTESVWRRNLVWTYPAIADGHLYLRNDKEVVCYDIRDR